MHCVLIPARGVHFDAAWIFANSAREALIKAKRTCEMVM
jgi:hypothetical protein